VASFGTLTGFASRRLLPDLSNKIANMVTGVLQVEVKKQAQNQLESARSQAELLGMLADATTPQAPKAAQSGVAEPGTREVTMPPMASLAELVQKYMAVRGNDDQSLLDKRQIAADMLAVALQGGVTAEEILAKITPQAGDRDGWLLALASLIATSPAPGDGSRLLDVAALATHDFVRYRI